MKNFILILISVCLFVSCGTNKKKADNGDQVVAEQKLIALSFDDGPNTTTTVQMLDMLEKHGVKGSFYVIGKYINDTTAAVMKRAYDMGCDIQNHSFSHVPMNQLKAEEIQEEIKKTTDLIVKYIGEEPTYFRPPFIAYNQLMYDNSDLTFISGIGIEDWVPAITAEERAKRMLDIAADGVIYLLHDLLGNEATVQALDIAIPQLKEQGYQFVTIPELFKAKNITPERNKIYSNVLKD